MACGWQVDLDYAHTASAPTRELGDPEPAACESELRMHSGCALRRKEPSAALQRVGDWVCMRTVDTMW